MSNTGPVTVIYGTLCDMVEEIIGTERIIREATEATPATIAVWRGEQYAAQRMVSYVMSGGRDGSGRYSMAFGYLDTRIRQATVLPPSGTVVIGLRKIMEEMK